jgi:hypothetical protein
MSDASRLDIRCYPQMCSADGIGLGTPSASAAGFVAAENPPRTVNAPFGLGAAGDGRSRGKPRSQPGLTNVVNGRVGLGHDQILENLDSV